MASWMVVLIWVVVIAAALVGLYFWGRKLQNRYEEQQSLINQNKQAMTIFVIDKKKDKPANLRLPKQVKDQLPKMYKRRKMPVIIAKIGPQIQTLMCEEHVYQSIPVKKQVKVEMAGVLVVNVLSGKLPQTKKKGFMAKMRDRATQMTNKSKEQTDKKSK